MIDPPVWVPMAAGKKPAATPAADPDDDPPGVKAVLCGLRVLPGVNQANSVVTVFPEMVAPAARNMLTNEASVGG